MTPDAFLANAERMLVDFADNLDACRCRAIIHASYYAVFHLTALTLNVSVTGPDYAKHADLVRLVQANPGANPIIFEAKRQLRRLKQVREESDYALSARIGDGEARDAVDWAYEVFDAAGITPAPV